MRIKMVASKFTKKSEAAGAQVGIGPILNACTLLSVNRRSIWVNSDYHIEPLQQLLLPEPIMIVLVWPSAGC